MPGMPWSVAEEGTKGPRKLTPTTRTSAYEDASWEGPEDTLYSEVIRNVPMGGAQQCSGDHGSLVGRGCRVQGGEAGRESGLLIAMGR